MDTSTALSRGQPLAGFISSAGTGQLYTYRPSSPSARVDIVVRTTSLTDFSTWSAEVFVDYFPWPQHTVASFPYSYGPSVAYSRIDPTDPSSGQYTCLQRQVPQQDCVYYILAYSHSDNMSYTVVATEAPSDIAPLQSGLALNGSVSGSSPQYAFFTNYAGVQYLVFALTVSSGDCDLYISTLSARPGPGNSQWSSVDEGDDLLIVSAGSEQASSYYYTAVQRKDGSAQTCAYSLLASSYSPVPQDSMIYLTEDAAQKDVAMAGTYRYYYFYVTGIWSRLVVTLDSLRGDADIYVNRQPMINTPTPIPVGPTGPYIGAAVYDWRWPNASAFDYSSTTSGRDQVNVTDISGGFVLIAVYSKGVDSRYSIRVSSDGYRVRSLSYFGGLSQGSVRANEYHYYTITIPSTTIEYMLTLTLQPLSGDADLYVSDTAMPNTSYYNFSSSLVDQQYDLLVLKSSRLTAYGRPELHGGVYYVSVHGKSDAVYQLGAFIAASSPMRLNARVSRAFFSDGEIMHVQLQLPRGQEFTIHQLSSSGSSQGNPASVSIFVSAVADPNPSLSATYQWTAAPASLGAPVSLRVQPSADACQAAMCNYSIALQRTSSAATGSLSFCSLWIESPSSPMPLLQSGSPLEGSSDRVALGYYDLFRFNLSCAQSDVSLLITTQGSSIYTRLEVNRGSHVPALPPDYTYYNRMRTVGRYSSELRFNWTDRLLAGQSMQGPWTGSVYVYPPVAYTLSMSVREGDCSASPSAPAVQTVNFTSLTALQPQEGSVQAGGLTNFTFRTPAAGAGPSWPYGVYITYVPLTASASTSASLLARADSQWPRVGFSQWQATSGSDSSSLTGSIVLRIEPGSGTGSAACVPSSVAGCVYSLAVTSASASRFMLTASLSAPVLALQPNAALPPQGSSLSAGQADHWSAALNATSSASSLSLVLESCMGSSSLFVNYRTAAIPSSSASDLSLTGVSAVRELAVPVSSGQSSPVVMTVVGGASGSGSSAALYRLASLPAGLSWSSASPSVSDPVLRLQSWSSTPTGRIRFRLQPASVPVAVQQQSVRQPAGAQGVLKYSVYVMAAGDEAAGGLNAASRCGLHQLTAIARLNLTAAQLTSAQSTVELKAPSRLTAARYTLIVLAEHVWRSTQQGLTEDQLSTPGYTIYTPLTNVRAGTYIPDDDGGGGGDDGGDGGQTTGQAAGVTSAGSMQPFIIGGVVLGLVLVLVAAIAARWWWLSRRRKQMQLAAGETELLHGQQQQRQQHQQPLILNTA